MTDPLQKAVAKELKARPVACMGFTVRPSNPDSSSRGHAEQVLARSVVCRNCHKRKPKRGGWSQACEADDRLFMGG